jgi:hypothetical protein
VNSKNGGVQNAYTEEQVKFYLLYEKYALNRTLRDLASEFSVSHGVIQRALKGQFPKRKDLRDRMCLVPTETIEACLNCGMVHTTKRCTSNNSKPRPPRIAIRLDNPDSAARSIINNMGAGEREELIEILLENRQEI